MRTRLLWDGAAALGSVLLVSGTLWFLVRRIRLSGHSRRDSHWKHRHADLSAAAGDTDAASPRSSGGHTETMAAPGDQRQ